MRGNPGKSGALQAMPGQDELRRIEHALKGFPAAFLNGWAFSFSTGHGDAIPP